MTDFKEEQNNEIEALESIYPEEIEGKVVNDASEIPCFDVLFGMTILTRVLSLLTVTSILILKTSLGVLRSLE
jgi:hypothetical protein